VATARAAPFLSLEPVGCGDDGVPVEFAVVVGPCALGAGELPEGAGGACVAPAGADGGGVDELGAGGDEAGGGAFAVVVGVEAAGGGGEVELAGGGDAAVGGAGDDGGGGVVEVAGGGDGDAGGGAEAVGAGALPPPVPLRPAVRTMTMTFSLARQLASTPLMKKRAPERSSVYTVSPSSNLFTYDDVLQAL
jgi:hypothetical protein